ncbi:MAG: serine/threonine-protein kinase, partial [Myxococcota bacterium]
MTASYEVLQILGSGSSSTVVLAHAKNDPRRVVLKVLQPELLQHQQLLARTRDEARLLDLLRHPNIVGFEELVVHHGRPVVVMEFVDGVDLGTLLRLTGPLGPREAVEVVTQAASALHAANTGIGADGAPLRVVHRDIKPSNLLLARSGAVKVVDFGLARAEFAGREARTDAFVLGSMGFVAPERYDALEPSPAVDVYALGVTLAQLLARKVLVLPREVERHDRELAQQLSKLCALLPTLDPAASDALVGMISSMCSFDAEARPTAAEVTAQGEAWLGAHGRGDLALSLI